MTPPPPRLHLDPVDPWSFLTHRAVRAFERETGHSVERRLVELRPPPAPLTDTEDPFWAPRWARAEEDARDLVRPPLVPWSRKCAEVVRHAEEKAPEVVAGLLDRLLETFHLEGRDIGRVDVLVGLAVDAGLDLTETKAVLDVDRFEAEAAMASERFAREGRGVPLIEAGGESLEGFHEPAAILTFLRGRQSMLFDNPR